MEVKYLQGGNGKVSMACQGAEKDRLDKRPLELSLDAVKA